MTFPVAKRGYWISADKKMDKHDCAVAGHMPEACPGGTMSQSLDYCYKHRHDRIPAECKPVLGSVCTDGYWGPKCAKCCKLNEECSHLAAKGLRTSWYLDEEKGLCTPCPNQDLSQVVIIGGIVLFVGS
eukprot:COSAG01_NODE_23252_length_822_cov_1.069156_2_plen_128_part_01